MDLLSAIDRDKQALQRIVAGLFGLLGRTSGHSSNLAPQHIARSLHSMISLVLRPAESAVRRLIVLVSLTLKMKPADIRPMPRTLSETLAEARPASRKGKCRRAFRLFDPRLRLVRRERNAPRQTLATSRISFFGDGEVRTVSLGGGAPDKRESDDLIASAALLRRLEALQSALGDLPRQARRLARALQRRQKVPRLKLQGAIRPGHPPGHRSRPRHEIDEVLRRCHWRAREALPDTS